MSEKGGERGRGGVVGGGVYWIQSYIPPKKAILLSKELFRREETEFRPNRGTRNG